MMQGGSVGGSAVGAAAPAQRLRAVCRGVSGWRHKLAAMLLGVASVLAMAPFFLWPVLLVTLPCLVWLIDERLLVAAPAEGAKPTNKWHTFLQRRSIRAAVTAWWFGFGYHLAGLFWIGEAFLVEAEKFAMLMPFAVTLMPAGLALFWGAAAAAVAPVWRPGVARVVALAIALAVAEWLRGHILSGFPWNVLGYALTYPLALMQSASLIGIYGLALLALIALPLPLIILTEAKMGTGAARPWVKATLPLSPLLVLAVFGLLRLRAAEPAPNQSLTIRIVQPSVPQREKWRPENQEKIFLQHIDLSLRDGRGTEDGARGIKLIVWPEAAMPFLPLHSPVALAAIGRMLPEGTHLASGALRMVEKADRTGRDVFNSLLVFGQGGRLTASYDKIHLVPFGEYLPLQTTLEAIGLEQLSRLRGGFSAGPWPRPLLAIPGLPKLGPLICYEAIFPATLVQGAERPAALINVTNDGWFGNTTGPRQHLHQARVRAVEEGLPILRAANNGISAIIDAKGRILASAGMNVIASIDGTIPAALSPPPYAQLGDWAFAILLAFAGVLWGWLRQRGENGKHAASRKPD